MNTKNLKVDAKYAKHRRFNFFDINVDKDYSTGKEKDVFRLSSEITESDMREDQPNKKAKEETETTRKYMDRLQVFFDEQDKPQIDMDLSAMKLAEKFASKPKVMNDAKVVDTLEIDFSSKEHALFKEKKPKTVFIIILDKDKKIVNFAEVSSPKY